MDARILLLIDAFSAGKNGIEGRTKLAKIDFFVRYPEYLKRALKICGAHVADEQLYITDSIESRMVRYRFGPWDPAYYPVLGSLLGRGLIELVPGARGVSYRPTALGREVAARLKEHYAFRDVVSRLRAAHECFSKKGGTWLKDFIYKNFPEVTEASWGDVL